MAKVRVQVGCNIGFQLGPVSGFRANLLLCERGSPPYVVGHAMDITEQKRAEYQLQSTLRELQKTLAEVRTLEGLLPICAWCRRILR